MLKSFLIKNFGFNEPIFLNELTAIHGISDNAIRQSVKRLVASGFLKRYDTGIYDISRPDCLLDKGYLDPNLVLERKYIKNKEETFGYIAGHSFANQLGLTTQMPAVIEVVTNRESTNGRFIKLGTMSLRLKKPAVLVSRSNAELLQFLEGVNQAEKFSELSKEETISVLADYARRQHFTREQLSVVISGVTGSVAKKLIEWGIIYEFDSEYPENNRV